VLVEPSEGSAIEGFGMNINAFIVVRPYLYHLTDRANLDHIVHTQSILSTKRIIEISGIQNGESFLRSQRSKHEIIPVGDKNIKIRDQRPISIKALSKCLADDWNPADFIEHINKRVFFWCSLDRLLRHFNRYIKEQPKILKCRTKDIIDRNGGKVEYCGIDSGSTRPNYRLGGSGEYRGPDTFLPYHRYNQAPRSVVEVTVLEYCDLPSEFYVSDSPRGPWQKIKNPASGRGG
jgi:hypothetical protein